MVQTRVSIKRIQNFLSAEELDIYSVGSNPEKGEVISSENAEFSWSRSIPPTLKDLNLHIKPGQLISVVGRVASGKSSLISAIMGDMHRSRGTLNVMGSIAYLPQQAWIQNATLRQNVLFRRPMDKKKYNKVLEACCLIPDLAILEGGDQTEIGEKGINLSGGQKQRVSLARAVYQNEDIYLLDDPLSAVDSHVGKDLFDKVIGPNGILKRKTRILVTHNVSVLPEVDVIWVMKDGEISEVGSYQQLLADGGEFSDFIKEFHNKAEDKESQDEVGEMLNGIVVHESLKNRFQTQRSVSWKSVSCDSTNSMDNDSKQFKLIDDEAIQVGKVKLTNYINYIKNIGLPLSIVILLNYGATEGFGMATNVWLSFWSNDQPLKDGTQDVGLRNYRLIIYGVLGFLSALTVTICNIAMAFGGVRAANLLHRKVLKSVLKSPMSFFDTTPLGRILNRFGKEIDTVDTQMPLVLDGLLYCFFNVFGTFIIIAMNNPIFIAFAIPITIIYYYIQKFFIVTSRQLKRLESISRSPIYSNFSETITGASVIRAFRAKDYFVDKQNMLVDTNLNYDLNGCLLNRWLAIRLDLLASFVVLITALTAVFGKGEIDGGSVGLSLSYALSVTDAMTWLVRLTTEIETKIVSVERLEEYSILKHENAWDIPSTRPSYQWPQAGNIILQGFNIRYREGLDLVLKDIDLEIEPGEKVGIVGRTGAGKSSLTLGLFRIMEPASGKIFIDGVNIRELGLHQLRSALTVIPQEPVLFSGTLRMNLDPCRLYDDSTILNALELAHMKDFVCSFEEGLEHQVVEGGENLSVGQRQLVCLGRALLRRSKVLVMDEATAAVDLKTDKLIQDTIRKEFSHSTIVTIAHRLHTILDYNRVIVMDKGRIVEEGEPLELMKDPKSLFYSMAKDAGLV